MHITHIFHCGANFFFEDSGGKLLDDFKFILICIKRKKIINFLEFDSN